MGATAAGWWPQPPADRTGSGGGAPPDRAGPAGPAGWFFLLYLLYILYMYLCIYFNMLCNILLYIGIV